MSQVPSATGELKPGAETAPTAAYVLCRTGPGQPLRFRLSSATVVAGSDAGLGIPLPLPGVSRQHLKLVFEGGSWWVQDLDSSNGTFLNGRLVARDRLRHLDVIGVGRGLEMLFLQRDEAPAALRRGITHAAIVAERGADAVQPIAVGEVTLGRSSTCNIQVEGAAISKIHARIERTPQQLTLRDLGSANGTYVNGQQVTVAALKDGDVISLGEMVRFRVVIEYGEVKTITGARSIPEIAAAEDAPALSMDWKTRYDWDEAEMRQIAELQQKLRARDEEKKVVRRDTEKAMPAAKAPPRPATTTPVAKPAADKPAAAAPAATPAAPEKAAAPAPEKAVAPAPAPKPPAPADKPAEPPVANAAVPPPPPRAAAPAPAPADDVPATLLPGQLKAAVEPPIRRVLLVSATEQLVAEGPGTFEVGRATDAALRAQHPTVSRKHARIVVAGATATLEDLGGRSGTFLNDQPVTAPMLLANGDRLLLGEARYEVRLER